MQKIGTRRRVIKILMFHFPQEIKIIQSTKKQISQDICFSVPVKTGTQCETPSMTNILVISKHTITYCEDILSLLIMIQQNTSDKPF